MASRIPMLATLFAACTLAACSGGGGGSAGNDRAASENTSKELPLLDLDPVRSPNLRACRGQPDSTPLPVDARSLIVEGMETGAAAVQFNAWWVDVHNPAPPFLKNPLQRPTTCGEWKAQVAEGSAYLKQLAMSGTVITAKAYNQIWQAWGLGSRPGDFDRETVQRWGLAPATYRNPYPLTGEDPAATDGGSGQLPAGLVQIRDDSGRYTGNISMNCSICHDSEFGTAQDGAGFGTVWGRGNDNVDLAVMSADFTKASLLTFDPAHPTAGATGLVPVPLAGTTRGITDPTSGFEVVFATRDLDTMDLSPNPKGFPFHSSGGSLDGITWGNLAYRPRKFMAGDLSADEIAAMASFLLTDFENFSDGVKFKAQAPRFEQVKSYIESLSLPAYPRGIDLQQAEAGAILFHAKDLWAGDGNSDIPRPAGNGSCASCHGAYSPRYAADPSILPDPRLQGIGAYLVPLEIIGTDPNRATQVGGPQADAMRTSWDTSWMGYVELHPDYAGSNQSAGGMSAAEFVDDYLIYQGSGTSRLKGPNTWQTTDQVYLAPPLYGVWMSAPYFHNGSVPDVWGVLQPQDRPAVWQRPLTEPGESGINRGFDRSLAAYDFDKLGWKYREIPCDTTGVMAAASCTPGQDPINSLLAALAASGTGSTTWLTYLFLPPFTPQQVEARMVYNTHAYTQGNGGHAFTQVLHDAERRALIEYLKTL